MDKNPILQDDIRRYKKNKFAAGFALLALVFNCLYFALLYSILSTDLYKLQLGISVIVNLLVLLIGFYASEGIKGYNKKFSIVLAVLAAVQIIRVIYYPAIGAAKNWLADGNLYFFVRMNNSANATMMIIYLVASAACFIVAAVHGFLVARRLEVFQKKLDNGEVSVEETLKEIDAQEAAVAAQNVSADSEAKPSEVKELVETGEATLSNGEADNG
ncbi:MAG: hypothetical protein NC131_03865 [Roseburia sp.]|nr:hypothetical protein [Roseburia sp.]